MAPSLVATPTINANAQQVLSETEERKLNMRQHIEKLLREMFEGHKELLRVTPDLGWFSVSRFCLKSAAAAPGDNHYSVRSYAVDIAHIACWDSRRFHCA